MTFAEASAGDVATVEALLGRSARGRFAVVVRRSDGRPVVIENEPHLRDGTPMPTLFWLVDAELREAVSRLESAGGVKQLEARVDPDELAATHARYAERRRRATVRDDVVGATGGVGGTRRGVKCLHAHLAHHLAGGVDPVGALVAEALALPDLVTIDARG
ncbi:MAG: DUF501 domain-containing protein [Acidimicrobiales bacterium]